MRNEITYEWTLEVMDGEDIVDSDFQDTLNFDRSLLIGNDLGLVRNIGNEEGGLQERYWAYVEDGKLPQYFTDSIGDTVNIKVPAKFHNELKKYFS